MPLKPSAEKKARHPSFNKNAFPSFQNFLQYGAQVLPNIEVSLENGKAVADFELNLENFSTVLFLATTEDLCTHKILSLDNSLIPKRDLSLKIPLDNQRAYVEARRTQNCLKYE